METDNNPDMDPEDGNVDTDSSPRVTATPELSEQLSPGRISPHQLQSQSPQQLKGNSLEDVSEVEQTQSTDTTSAAAPGTDSLSSEVISQQRPETTQNQELPEIKSPASDKTKEIPKTSVPLSNEDKEDHGSSENVEISKASTDQADVGDSAESRTFPTNGTDLCSANDFSNVAKCKPQSKKKTLTPIQMEAEQSANLTSNMASVGGEPLSSPETSSSTSAISETALCKYRWAKVFSTNSADIGFYPSYSPREPILLSWDSTFKAYLSPEIRLQCGNFHGFLKVDGESLAVEDFHVKSYTFEVDLFIKEDALDNKTPPMDSGTFSAPAPTDASTAAVLPQTQNVSSKPDQTQVFDTSSVQDVVLPRRQHSGEDIVAETKDSSGPSLLPAPSPSMRLQPHASTEDLAPLSTYETRYKAGRSSPSSPQLAGSERPFETSNDTTPNDRTTSRSRPADEPPMREYTVPYSRETNGGTSHAIQDQLLGRKIIDHIVSRTVAGGEEEEQSLDRRPQRTKFPAVPSVSLGESSVAESEKPERLSGFRRVTPGTESERRSSSHTANLHDKEEPPVREMPLPQSGHDGIYGRPPPASDLHSNSRHDLSPEHCGHSYKSPSDARHDAQTSSASSYRDSTAYRANDRYRSNGGEEREPTRDSSHRLYKSRESSTDRAASLPPYESRSHADHEMRSSTPNHRAYGPPTSSWNVSGGGNPNSTDRGDFAPGGKTSTAHSEGRYTPVSGFGERESVDSGSYDLRETVTSLRRLLHQRDTEVRDLRDELQQLQHSGRASSSRSARGRSSRSEVVHSIEYKQLQSEKEILETQVTSLRDDIKRLTSGSNSDRSTRNSASAISDYSPTNPLVLQRKIGDLEAHIHDLQEVNESTTSSLTRAEEKMRLLQEENHDLRTKAGYTDNMEAGEQHSLRVQLRTLREDIASLRERNFQLTEENMRLQEAQPTGSRSTTAAGLSLQRPVSSLGLRTDPSNGANTSSYSAHYTTSLPPSTSLNYLSDRSSVSQGYSTLPSARSSGRPSREDLAPKDYRSRGGSLGRASGQDFAPSSRDVTSAKTSARHFQQHTVSDNPRAPVTDRPTSASNLSFKPPSSKTSSYTRDAAVPAPMSLLDRTRSRPDGEVSEHVHSDRYHRTPYHEPSQRERAVTSTPSKDISNGRAHSSGGYPYYKEDGKGSDRRRENSYRTYLSETSSDLAPRSTAAPSTSLGSKDIFTKLKTKLASQWLQQENRYISGNLNFDRYHTPSAGRPEEDGDDSDTATDILLAQDTAETQAPYRSSQPFHGSDGVTSGSGASSDECPPHTDQDVLSTSSLRRRARSADPFLKPGGGSGSSRINIPGPGNTSGSSRLGGGRVDSYNNADLSREGSDIMSVSTAGHRSVLPKPLVTQHNKHELAKRGDSLLNSSLTQGLRPFAPRSPADIRIDDVVKFSRLGGRLTQGAVKYVGHLPGRSEVYLGVELDRDEGKHDGTFEDVRYFKCKSNKGVFVAFNKIVMAWAP